MTEVNLDKIGSRTALFVGLPIGTIFSSMVLILSLFPVFDFGFVLIGGKLFWHPLIWAGIIPLTFVFLLWKAGGKIKKHLDEKHSILSTSLKFTIFVNSWLFGLIFLNFIVGGLFFSFLQPNSSVYLNLIAFALTILIYLVSTILTTVTIGLLIVIITKKRIYG
jgi:hypothetical protein